MLILAGPQSWHNFWWFWGLCGAEQPQFLQMILQLACQLPNSAMELEDCCLA